MARNNNLISETNAKEILKKYFISEGFTKNEWAINNKNTIKNRYCFIFHYNPVKYFYSKNFDDAGIGNNPILVDRRDGEVIPLYIFCEYEYLKLFIKYRNNKEKFKIEMNKIYDYVDLLYHYKYKFLQIFRKSTFDIIE